MDTRCGEGLYNLYISSPVQKFLNRSQKDTDKSIYLPGCLRKVNMQCNDESAFVYNDCYVNVAADKRNTHMYYVESWCPYYGA